MSDDPQPAAEYSSPAAPESGGFGWFSNKELRGLAWTTAVALCAGLMHVLGAAVETGRLHALSIYGFSRPTFSQDYVIDGAVAVIAIFTPWITVALVVMIGLKLVGGLYRRISGRFAHLLPTYTAKVIWWASIVVVIVGLGMLNVVAFDLVKQADGLILKHQEDLGTTWMNMVLDEGGDWFSLYWLGLCGGMALLFIIARSVVSGFKDQRYKVLFVAWSTLQALVLCAAYSCILGATLTIDEYPVVAFSNSSQMLGTNAIPILIGQDDKQFAILVAQTCKSQSGLTSTVLYLPRSEVKWMIVLRQEPLHLFAHLRELAQRASTPCQAESPSLSPPTSK
jgi:hypothetical protein